MVRFDLLFFSDHIETSFVIGQNPKFQLLFLAPQKLVTHGTGLAKRREIIWQTPSMHCVLGYYVNLRVGDMPFVPVGVFGVVLNRRKHVTCPGL